MSPHRKIVPNPTALTIAGFDPTGGAGITRDLLTFSEHHVTGFSVITANTIQNGVKVFKSTAIKPSEVQFQLETLLKRHKIDIVKIGMSAKGETLKLILNTLKKHKINKIILDPIILSSGGTKLIDSKGVSEIIKNLKDFYLITPNLTETEELIKKTLKIKTIFDMKAAATVLSNMGAQNILITGGHLKDAPTDLFYNGKDFTIIKGKRIETSDKNLHGTGCILSSAIASDLATGKDLKESIRKSKRYLERVILDRS